MKLDQREIATAPEGAQDDSSTSVVPLRWFSHADAAPVHVVHLLCVAGDDLGETFMLDTESVTLGRGSVDVLLRATDVSRHHARITRREGRYWIEDTDSANGTFVNGTRISDITELQFGDRVQVGTSVLVFARSDELEQRLRKVQKLEAMGSLVKGIAHDFNNTLQTLLGCIEELALSAVPGQGDVLDEMRNVTESASAIVRRLLRVGRGKPETLDLVAVGVVVQHAVAMARRGMPPNIVVDVALGDDAYVRCSRSEIEQALLNLLVNARDAMPAGGTINVTTKVVALDRGAALSRHLPLEGRYLELVVTDAGVGMDEQTIARVWEPFFTT
ncbi:MAG TPA: FHA domain-containing protein, partial [Kofleriaceae bacterium]|nr:FHA domain-containing protein [Kofleriaceae bacterium]